MDRTGSAFGLLEKPESLGIDCGPDGLTLAGVPLLKRDAQGFRQRPPEELHWLATSAYGRRLSIAPIENGLAAVARALNEGATGRAMIAAVMLKLPALDWAGAARIAKADEALSNYNPDEPRDSDGRWTTSLTLPPGQRIDELGSLLEWIANARPEEAPIIRSEIKRYYYDVGDVRGGNALNEALSNIVYGEPTQEERQDVLDSFEMYTRADPADIAQIGRDLLMMGFSHPMGVPAEVLETAVAETPSAWRMGWASRGLYIEKMLGGNLPPGFPVVDRFADGVVTSIKSIDLNAASYQTATRLISQLNRYVDSLAGFKGDSIGNFTIEAEKVTGRILNLATPEGAMTSVQRTAIETARKRAKTFGVDLIVTPF